MRPLAALALLLGALVTVPAAAQQPVPPPGDSAHPVPPPPPPPPPPTPAQLRYLQGLRTAGRGVAQLKDGISRVARTQSTHDTLQVRQAGQRLGGLCSAAHGFIVSGRAAMEPNVYQPPTRAAAKDLGAQLDSLSSYAATCQRTAGKTPAPVSAELYRRIRTYEAALAVFRSAIGLPNR